MSKEVGSSGRVDQEVVKTLIDTGAVNFEAIGAALAKFGPRAALSLDEDWESFCLTMKYFLRIHRFPGPIRDIEDLGRLREIIAPEVGP
jgi:hypothetical protein